MVFKLKPGFFGEIFPKLKLWFYVCQRTDLLRIKKDCETTVSYCCLLADLRPSVV